MGKSIMFKYLMSIYILGSTIFSQAQDDPPSRQESLCLYDLLDDQKTLSAYLSHISKIQGINARGLNNIEEILNDFLDYKKNASGSAEIGIDSNIKKDLISGKEPLGSKAQIRFEGKPAKYQELTQRSIEPKKRIKSISELEREREAVKKEESRLEKDVLSAFGTPQYSQKLSSYEAVRQKLESISQELSLHIERERRDRDSRKDVGKYDCL